MFGGTYTEMGSGRRNVRMNPFAIYGDDREQHVEFLSMFIAVLMEQSGRLEGAEEDLLHAVLQDLYDRFEKPRLSDLAQMLPSRLCSRLQRWLRKWKDEDGKWHDGKCGWVFDNEDDTVSFSEFQTFDFQGMEDDARLMEPLLFYIFHRADQIINDPKRATQLKEFLVDEAWVALGNPRFSEFLKRAVKTWRKRNGMLILSTQSFDEVKNSNIRDVLVENCVTKLFLSNPQMDEEVYRKVFKLNEVEVEAIKRVVPKRGLVLAQPDLTKPLNLKVDRKMYWISTNDPYDNARKLAAMEKHGDRWLEVLCEEDSGSALGSVAAGGNGTGERRGTNGDNVGAGHRSGSGEGEVFDRDRASGR